jgi:hypothetical protein
MQYAYTLSGSKVRYQKFPIGEAMANAGVPVVTPATLTNGIALAAAATAVDSLGITIDAAATYNTAQQTDNSDPAAYVTVITNPDAVFQCRLNGSATVDGTALVQYFNTAASTTGLTVTPSLTSGGAAVDTTATIDTSIMGYTGANAGIIRQISVGDASNTDVIVAFPYDIAVDDIFIYCNFVAGGAHFVTLTTSLLEADATVATGEDTNNANYRPVELVLNDVGNNGVLNSYVNLIAHDHCWGGTV